MTVQCEMNGRTTVARAFGRIFTKIWSSGGGFVALGPLEQRLYMFLLSQPNLNHAGVLPITMRRWTNMTVGLTPKQLEQELRALEVAGWILLDFDQEELLIRRHILDDEVYKQPRIMGAAVSSAMEIGSAKLRRALAEEIELIPLDELNTKPGPGGTPSVRSQVEDHVIALRLAFRSDIPSQSPADGVASGAAATPGARVAATLPPTPAEGFPDGSPEDLSQDTTHVRAPVDNNRGADAAPAAEAAQESDSKGKRRRKPDYVAPRFEEFYAAYPRRIAPADAEKAWTKAIDAGTEPQLIIDAAKLFAMASRTKESDFIPYPATWLNRRQWQDEPDRAPAAPVAIGAPSEATRGPETLSFAEQMARLDALTRAPTTAPDWPPPDDAEWPPEAYDEPDDDAFDEPEL